MPPPDLAQIATRLLADAEQLIEEGNHKAAASVAVAAARAWQAYARMGQLPKSTVTDKLRGDMESAHRQKLSEAQAANLGKKTHPMLLEARKHGLYSLKDLADALDYSKSMLSRIMSGDRAMPADKAKRFEEITGKPWRSKS